MSMEALRWAWPLDIKGAKKAVLVALAEHADALGKCWPSIERIALYAGISQRAVSREIGTLEGIGLLSADRSAGRNTSRYHLHIGTIWRGQTTPPPARQSAPIAQRHPDHTMNGKHFNPDSESGLTLPQCQGSTLPECQGSGASTLTQSPSTLTQSHPNPKEPSKKKVSVPPITPQGGLVCDAPDFETFWQRYPRKDSKGHARRAWNGAARKTDPATIIAGLAAYPFNSNPRFHPMPATWLNGERWLPVETVVKRGAWDWLDDMLTPQAGDPDTIDGEVCHEHYAARATH